MSDSTQHSTRSSKRNKLNHSSSFKGQSKSETPFNRDNELRHSTGSIKGKTVNSADATDGSAQNVHNLIKGFQTKIQTNGSPKRNSNSSVDGTSYQSDFQTPGYVAESPLPERSKNRTTTKRKLSLRYKKGKISSEDARQILQSLGMSPYLSNDHRGEEKSFAYFDVQSLFFALGNAAQLKLLYGEGSTYTKKLTGASAASVRNTPGRSKVNAGEFDPAAGRFRSRTESMIDEGDNKENDLVQNCPYFRNEIADIEETDTKSGEPTTKHGRDITKLISMFNRNRSFENIRNNVYDQTKTNSYSRRDFDSSEQDILLEEVKDGSSFLTWDEPNVSGKRIFDFEHIDRGALYYKEYFSEKEHCNLFGIDEKFGPLTISIIREVLNNTAVWGHTSHESNEKNKKYQFRIIFRSCELYALRIAVLESSIPSTSRHGGNKGVPIKDVLEFCFPELQLSCLRYCTPGPKVIEQLIKLDEQQLSLKYKIGLIYCKAGQKSEEEMYNNEHGGSEFLEFCSVIADKVALKGFTGYRAQLDNKNDSTGAHSLYTTFHGREVMFHVSTELPYTNNDRQQLLRKRHIGNDIVTVIFQEPGCVAFTPQMMRSHFQHVFIVVRVENPHTAHTKYEVAVSRSRDVPYFGPPIPPQKFSKNAAFREFLLSKLCNAENAAHKSEKFTHMARRTRYEYLKDLATNQVSTQTLETSTKFAFPSFSSKKKEKTRPAITPEIWLQGGMVWSVKFDLEHEGPSSQAYLSISSKSIIFVGNSTQEVMVAIPCKQVLGWRATSHSLKLFYDTGKMAYFTMCDDDLNELPYVINRLKAVTPGCETQDLALRRNNDGQLGFHVFYEGLVAEVEPYGLAWQSGLRKGSRLLEISGHPVGGMSHERMILMLKRPGAVRIVVLPPAPDGQPRNYKAVRNLRRYSSMTSVYSMSMNALVPAGDSSSVYSSKENINGSIDDSSPQPETTIHYTERERHASEGLRRKESQNSSISNASVVSDTSSYDVPASDKPPTYSVATQQQSNQHKQDTPQMASERFITSRSATDIVHQNGEAEKRNPLAPSGSVELELGEIERQLTDTRKSIDAKFYRTLANSPNPFFGKSSQIEMIEEPADDISESSNDKPYVQQEDISSDKHDRMQHLSSRTSMEQAFENSQVPPTPTNTTQPQPTSYGVPKFMIGKSDAIDLEIDTKRGRLKLKHQDGITKQEDRESSPDTNLAKSHENLSGKDSDSSKKVNIVRTKVRDAKEIISERRSVKDSPGAIRKHEFMKKSHSVDNSMKTTIDHQYPGKDVHRHSLGSRKAIFEAAASEQPKVTSKSPKLTRNLSPLTSPNLNKRNISPLASPKLSKRDAELLRAVDIAAKNKASAKKLGSHDSSLDCPKVILDESLTETFAKIDAAFGFKPSEVKQGDVKTSDGPSQLRDEKRKKKRPNRRRSRNFQPPSSESSDNDPDPKRRGRTTPRRATPEDELISPRLPKSEAEESLEAAISEFNLELSSMPEKHRSDSFNSVFSTNHNIQPNETSTPPITPKEEKGLPFQKISSHIHQATRDEQPPKVPLRTSNRPQILIDHQKNKLKQRNDSKPSTRPAHLKENRKYSEPASVNSRVRTEVMTSLRPWSPPLAHAQNSSHIKDIVKLTSGPKVAEKVAVFDPVKSHEVKGCHVDVKSKKSTVTCTEDVDVKSKKSTINEDLISQTSHIEQYKQVPNLDLHTDEKEEEEILIEDTVDLDDQLSPLPRGLTHSNRGGIHSLPNRSAKKRRATLSEQEIQKSQSASCIPLVVRGLDLAASKSDETTTVPWSKEDLTVMLTVMESELEQEREEKERLSQELNRSREEKERLLEQSKQAASQLRKFTSLFLDASPQELEKAKQRYSDTR